MDRYVQPNLGGYPVSCGPLAVNLPPLEIEYVADAHCVSCRLPAFAPNASCVANLDVHTQPEQRVSFVNDPGDWVEGTQITPTTCWDHPW